MKLIAADIGNSVLKLGFNRANYQLVQLRVNEICELDTLQILPESPCFWVICSVSSEKTKQLLDWNAEHRPDDVLHLVQADDVPLPTNIDSREQLGLDRLIAAWQAKKMFFDDREVIVIDAGTAVTIDKVGCDGVFQGGVIFPGAGSCLKLLADTTSKLPELNQDEWSIDEICESPIGQDTELAILRGVYQAQIAAICQIVENMSQDCHVVATGGEVDFVQRQLPDDWNIEPFLLLAGIRDLAELLPKKRI